jgi:hypothetical protein
MMTKGTEGNEVAHAVIVNVARATLHGRLIEKDNVFVIIISIVPGLEGTLLYEANNNDDPPMEYLSQALKSKTKWPLEALSASQK